jgi:hypothetical protein
VIPGRRRASSQFGFKNMKHTVWILLLIAAQAALGQAGGAPRGSSPVVTASAGPIITILPAASGALLRSEGASRAAVDLGTVSYFRGASAQGESSQRSAGALVISTRFAVEVDCPGSPPASLVNVTMSRTDAAATHGMAIDGIKLGTTAQPFVQSMPCGSSGEHRLEVEVPASAPAGPIGSTVAFLATLRP